MDLTWSGQFQIITDPTSWSWLSHQLPDYLTFQINLLTFGSTFQINFLNQLTQSTFSLNWRRHWLVVRRFLSHNIEAIISYPIKQTPRGKKNCLFMFWCGMIGPYSRFLGTKMIPGISFDQRMNLTLGSNKFFLVWGRLYNNTRVDKCSLLFELSTILQPTGCLPLVAGYHQTATAIRSLTTLRSCYKKVLSFILLHHLPTPCLWYTLFVLFR